jgi:hypothetical protein
LTGAISAISAYLENRRELERADQIVSESIEEARKAAV